MAQSQKLDKIKTIVNKLDDLTKDFSAPKVPQIPGQSGSSSSEWTFPPMTDFDTNIQNFQNFGNQIGGDLVDLTTLTVKSLNLMKVVLEFSFRAVRPDQNKIQEVQKSLQKCINPITKFQGLDKPFEFHSKSVVAGLSIIFWPLTTMPGTIVDSSVESADYYALKLKGLKNKQYTEWYALLNTAMKSLKPYVVENFAAGPAWNGKGTQDFTELINVVEGKQEKLTSNSNIQGFQQQKPQKSEVSTEGIPDLTEFDSNLNKFQQLSSSTPEELQGMTKVVTQVFDMMKQVIKFSFKAKKFQENQVKEIQKAFVKKINEVAKFQTKEDHRPHQKAIIDGLGGSIWVLTNMPKMVIESGIESSEYNALKLKQQKIKENTDWYNAFHTSLKTLRDYAIANFEAGLNFNPKGTDDISELLVTLTGEQTQPQGQKPQTGGPMPPPPPIGDLLKNINPDDLKLSDINYVDDGKGDLFKQLNVGENGIKAHLRHIDKKNPPPVQKAIQSKTQIQTKQAEKVTKPPNKFFKNKQWIVEYFVNDTVDINEEDLDPKYTVLIDKCKNTTIRVNGKANNIVLFNCEKVIVVFKNLVSGVETVNCKRLYLTCIEHCPCIQVDKTDECQILLGQDRNTEVLSSKSSTINISYPIGNDDVSKEYTVPEQFKTRYEDGQFVTEIFEQNLG